jgi:cysteinyl-tRNA synthetase
LLIKYYEYLQIIINARQQYLFNAYKQNNPVINDSVITYTKKSWNYFVEKRFADYGLSSASAWPEFLKQTPPDPLVHPKFAMYMKIAQSSHDSLKSSAISPPDLFYESNKDVLSLFLDHEKGHQVTDPKIYRDFAAFWEKEFLKDMQMLNVRPPSVTTRVSEYIPEIVDYISTIISNGFGYVTQDGSVYFDTTKFDTHPDFHYAKLEPWAKGDLKLVEEGEGDLSKGNNGALAGKKNKSDFALWKASKSGEPAWSSPFGMVSSWLAC